MAEVDASATAALTVAVPALAFTGPPVVNEQFRSPPEIHP